MCNVLREGFQGALVGLLLLVCLGSCAAESRAQVTSGEMELSPLPAAPPTLAAHLAELGAPDVQLPAVRLPSSVRRGVTLAGYTETVLADERTLSLLEEMWHAGVRWLALVPTWYQASVDATTITRKMSVTPTDEALRTCIRRAHQRGFRVFLKPHVDVETGEWRG